MFDKEKINSLLEEKDLNFLECNLVKNKFWVTDKKRFQKVNYKLITSIYDKHKSNNQVADFLISNFLLENAIKNKNKKVTFENFYDKFNG